ncbi:MAG: hypothetical protein JJE40_07385 [Vicinamibacteria bacterium]|nr:hypothetical protein [Vicinamibacteria bacterium]
MAKKQTAEKTGAKVPESGAGAVAGQVAESIGTSLAHLMNRKDALVRQLAEVEQQISSARQRVTAKVAERLPVPALGRGNATGAGTKTSEAKSGKTGNRKRKRPLPPDDPMVAATERARSAEAKGRAAQRARTSRRSGNR